MKPKVLVISGPTASFKSSGAIKIAQKFQELNLPPIEIVNFDSLLFYQELNIGTAKPSTAELSLVPHHLINIRSITTPLNASDFKQLAAKIIEEILARKNTPLLVGGSGFYLRALLKGMYEEEQKGKSFASSAHLSYAEVRAKLQKVDPESFDSLHPNDEYRNRRALDFFEHTGKKISSEKKKIQDPYNLSSNLDHEWDVLHLYFNIPKEEHQLLIKKRTEEMIRSGLIEEVDKLLHEGFSGEEKPLQSIGYFETRSFLRGEIKTEADLIEAIMISTRQLAKSQRTFFKKSLDKFIFHPLSDWNAIEEKVITFMSGSKHER